jgi:hypothetical protein
MDRVSAKTADLILIVLGDRIAVRPPRQISLMEPDPRPQSLLGWARNFLALDPAPNGPWSYPQQLRSFGLGKPEP